MLLLKIILLNEIILDLGGWIKDADNDITAMVQKYITEIEEMRAKLLESENICEQLRKESSRYVLNFQIILFDFYI